MTRLAILAACGLGLWAGAAAAQTVAPAERPMGPPITGPAAGSPPSLGGRQFPSGEVERQVRPQGDGPAAERDRRQLQELNALSRQLTPPGTPVPAPHVEPERRQ